jgi:DNA-binding beta-propeller fold protein YncE
MRLPGVLFVLLLALMPFAAAAQAPSYEVWVVDQADANMDGARIHIFSKASVGGAAWDNQREVVLLQPGAMGVGDGPGVRPHMLFFNNSHSHGILAYVASGHVQVIRASDRKVVASIDVGEQAHGAIPAPNDSYILVANQNGKKLARIKSDFAREQFTWEREADFDLKTIEGPDRPDNAPICPVLFAGNTSKAYVTLRGGGLAIVDTAATPMRVLKTFTKDEVAPAGCGGAVVGDKMYINSGTAAAGWLYVFDLKSDNLVKSTNLTSTGTDSHGVLALPGGYLWAANRGNGDNVVVLDSRTDEQVGQFAGFGQAPDLMDISPDGGRVFMSLRGPNNLTGGPPAKGETPGLAVLDVRDGGRSGQRAFFVPIGPQGERAPADPHGIAVRRFAQQAVAPVVAPTQLPRTGAPGVELLLLAGGAFGLLGTALRRRGS